MTNLEQLARQQALTVEVLRRVLEGKWDEARIHLDAIDPAHAGTWTNVAFPAAAAPAASALQIREMSSPNRWPGRPSGPPIALVVHTMAGTLGTTDGWFSNPASQVSAHYGVGLDGTIHRYVQDGDRAWANGIRERGNAWDTHGLPDGNPNELTLSIETEDAGHASQAVTDAQYCAVRDLGVALVAKYPSVRWLLRHADISPLSRPNCPGARWTASGRFAQLAVELGLRTLS